MALFLVMCVILVICRYPRGPALCSKGASCVLRGGALGVLLQCNGAADEEGASAGAGSFCCLRSAQMRSSVQMRQEQTCWRRFS